MASQLLDSPSLPAAPEGKPGSAELVRFYRDLLTLEGSRFTTALANALAAETGADADERRLRVMSRLRVCADMHARDAQRFADVYEALYATLPSRDRRTLEETERDAAMNGLRIEEFERVREYVPSLRACRISSRAQPPHLDRLSAILMALDMDLASA